MSLETFTAALIFAAVMGFTPGPNNVMLASSGARFGVGRSLPHLFGVTVGFPVMLLLVGLGLASILLASPMLQLAMKIVSCAYLLWLAFKIGRSASALDDSGSSKPLTFLGQHLDLDRLRRGHPPLAAFAQGAAALQPGDGADAGGIDGADPAGDRGKPEKGLTEKKLSSRVRRY
jgi:threonine/homoserine/homoserine lactone efflux protein